MLQKSSLVFNAEFAVLYHQPTKSFDSSLYRKEEGKVSWRCHAVLLATAIIRGIYGIGHETNKSFCFQCKMQNLDVLPRI